MMVQVPAFGKLQRVNNTIRRSGKAGAVLPFGRFSFAAFTLIELLVVIAIHRDPGSAPFACPGQGAAKSSPA